MRRVVHLTGAPSSDSRDEKAMSSAKPDGKEGRRRRPKTQPAKAAPAERRAVHRATAAAGLRAAAASRDRLMAKLRRLRASQARSQAETLWAGAEIWLWEYLDTSRRLPGRRPSSRRRLRGRRPPGSERATRYPGPVQGFGQLRRALLVALDGLPSLAYHELIAYSTAT